MLLKNYKSRAHNFFRRKSTTDISWMVGANIIIKPLQVAKSFIVAKYLGPGDYGILKSVELIQMLNKFGDLGFNSTVIRDVGTSLGGKNDLEIQEIKNNAYSSELVLTFTLLSIGLVSSFFFQSALIRYAIILSSVGLFTLKVQNLFASEAIINKRFKLISKLIVIQGVINSALIIATVSFIKIYAVLIFPIVSTVIIIFIYYSKINIPFSFEFNKSRLQSILKTSLKFTSGTLAFGVFRYTERIIIISMLGLQAVGFFGFADTMLALWITIFLTNIKVRKMDILEDLGKSAFHKVHRIVIKETIILTIISFIIVGISIVGLGIFVPMFLDKWIDGIAVAQIFMLILPLKVVNSYVTTVVKSPIVDKLLYSPLLQMAGVAILLTGTYALKHYDLLSLMNFIYIDILAYAFVHISWLFVYYHDFYKPYVKKNIA